MAIDSDTVLAEQESATHEATRPPVARKPSRGRRALIAWAAVIAACVAVAALAFAVLRGDDDDADFPALRLLPQSEQVDREAHLEGQARTYGGANTAEPANRAALAHQADEYVNQLKSRAEEAKRAAFVEGLTTVYGPAESASSVEFGGKLAERAKSASSSVASFPSVAAIEREAEAQRGATSPVFPSVGAIERQAQLEGQARTHSKVATGSNRAALENQADQYVESLESRAEAAASPVRPNWPSHTSLERQAESGGSSDEFVPGSRRMPLR